MSSLDSQYERTPEQRRQAIASLLALGLIRVLQRQLHASQKDSQSATKSVQASGSTLDDS